MANALHATIPVLASLDLDESAAFYTDRLGFAIALRAADYLIAVRDGCELHFWRCSDRHIAENTSCYLRGDVRALHADFTRRGLTHEPPAERPWGMRELYVIDPHGNLLKFGEPCEAPSEPAAAPSSD
ncbi:bleomycin resistance protein [Acidovorax sp. NCPPB 4044]|uniref:bleomycin resistance protein n=1 Tax=Acidovorax sp. NCPPB 4044 TaxID=2940490 RepID=UPI0023039F16|nr:VOC family protein [Acidovorax sp. NCPPB 4044]MDA8522085.1 VOC family protein [Acidovorax sp. NCPPB 4044]